MLVGPIVDAYNAGSTSINGTRDAFLALLARDDLNPQHRVAIDDYLERLAQIERDQWDAAFGGGMNMPSGITLPTGHQVCASLSTC